MPVRILGMIGVNPPAGATVHVIAGSISPSWIASHSRTHEEAGYDEVLVGYYSTSAEGFSVALHAAANTEKLSYLVAHRPGRVLPALMARKIATFDALTNGRLSVHVIIGGSDAEQQQEGDFTSKHERYERGGEYLDIMRKAWVSSEPFDYEGKYYSVRGCFSEVKPVQKPYPTLFFGGSSEGALEMGARHCDAFAMFGEPLKETAERIADYRARCLAHGRTARFNISFRPIIADTEGAAWDKAHKILDKIKTPESGKAKPISHSGERLMALASRGELHDERLWMPIAGATSGAGNTTCLVGTPEQVAAAILKYYRLGIASFLIRGFDPVADVQEFGRELIPRIRSGAIEIDKEQQTSAAE
jgi:alkanesulfonate monooxygenase